MMQVSKIGMSIIIKFFRDRTVSVAIANYQNVKTRSHLKKLRHWRKWPIDIVTYLIKCKANKNILPNERGKGKDKR